MGVTVAMRLPKIGIVISVASVTFLSGCQTMQESGGKVAGGVLGAAAGTLFCIVKDANDRDCAAAIVGGGALGVALGDLYDRRRARLREIANSQGASIEMEEVKGEPPVNSSDGRGIAAEGSSTSGLLATINFEGMFPVGAAEPSPAARDVFVSIGTAYAQDTVSGAPTSILVVGHTDATGTAEFNQRLSERRAQRIAELISKQGVPADRLYLQGVGSSQPIDTNQTIEGRARNRRVEILEVNSENRLISFAEQRRRDARFLAHAATAERPRQKSVASTAPAKPSTSRSSAPSSPSPSPQAERALPPATIDFGGTPANDRDTEVIAALGGPIVRTRWLESVNPLGAAYASPPAPTVPCHEDAPRLAGEVVQLSSGQSVESRYKTSDFLPGFNRRVWATTVNGHLVALGPVSVLREDVTLNEQPVMSIYADYPSNQTNARHPVTHAEIYAGTDGLLLRVYASGTKAELECLDVAFPSGGGTHAINGRLYYQDAGVLRAAFYQPALGG